MNKTTIFFGADHGGFELKTSLIEYLLKNKSNYDVQDLGTDSLESVDYPDFAKKVAQKVLSVPNSLGVLICGTGIGVSISANRFPGIRAALVHDEFTAEMAKKHNNANILCLGGRTTNKFSAQKLLDFWLGTEFEGGRHLKRLEKIDC